MTTINTNTLKARDMNLELTQYTFIVKKIVMGVSEEADIPMSEMYDYISERPVPDDIIRLFDGYEESDVHYCWDILVRDAISYWSHGAGTLDDIFSNFTIGYSEEDGYYSKPGSRFEITYNDDHRIVVRGKITNMPSSEEDRYLQALRKRVSQITIAYFMITGKTCDIKVDLN